MKWDDIKDKPREIDRLIVDKVMCWHKKTKREWIVLNGLELDDIDERDENIDKSDGNWYDEKNNSVATTECCFDPYRHPFRPSELIANAWEVVEKMCFDHWFEMDNNDTFKFVFHYYQLPEFNDYEAEEKTAPLAICHAALLAVGVLEE